MRPADIDFLAELIRKGTPLDPETVSRLVVDVRGKLTLFRVIHGRVVHALNAPDIASKDAALRAILEVCEKVTT